MNNVDKLMSELLMFNSELYQKGYITPTGGNISARLTDDPNKVLITPSQIYKKILAPEHMLTIDLDGNVLNDSKYKPSSETPFHTAIYRNRPDVNAVIHTHTINTTILALTNLEFLPITAETAGIGHIPTIDWTSGTAESGQQVVNALGKNGYFVQIQNHGLVVAGPSLQWAAGITDMIEIQCKILVTCKMMGMAPKVLPKEIVEAIQNAQKKGQSIG